LAGNADKRVEVRGFSFIKELFDSRNISLPLFVELAGECPAVELAQSLGIPPDMIESVFINGVARSPANPVRPGDRVAFVPPGTPGPYRVILGIAGGVKGMKPE